MDQSHLYLWMELESVAHAKLPFSRLLDAQAYEDIYRAHRQFCAQHQRRYSDVLTRLPNTHRQIVEALPYLLHVNSPSLPGWTSDAVAGIDGFAPTPSQRNAVRALAPAFRFREQPTTTTIEALYIMGSAGSMAQTRSSDIDIWICLPELLFPRLTKKVSRLERWAKEAELELQIFLVDPSRFHDANPTDASYSPLLLDEFYRSGCHIAGRYPLWWLVPPHSTQDEHVSLVDSLYEHRLIDEHAFHDFGPVQDVSRDALLAAVAKLIDQSLEAPHKSCLKLALLESYAHGAPLLSESYKDAVLIRQTLADHDVYALLNEHLESHFANDSDRIQFLRYAWLTKAIRGNSRLNTNRLGLERAKEWGYTDEQVERMRWPQKWSAPDLLDEQAQFAKAYKSICSFMRRLLQTETRAIERGLLQDSMRTLETATCLANDQGPLHPEPVAGYSGRTKFVPKTHGWALTEDGMIFREAQSRTALLHWLKAKGFPRAVLEEQNEPWVRSLWPLLGGQTLLVINAEPVPEHVNLTTDLQDLTAAIWSIDIVNHKGTVQTLPMSDGATAITEAISLAVNEQAHIVCLGLLNAGAIERRLRKLMSIGPEQRKDILS